MSREQVLDFCHQTTIQLLNAQRAGKAIIVEREIVDSEEKLTITLRDKNRTVAGHGINPTEFHK